MKLGVYEGVDQFVNLVLVKKSLKNDLNNFLASGFPKLFGDGNINFLQHLFTIPLPIRDQFVFFVLFGQSNTGIPTLNKEIILAFAMLDCSIKIPVLKNFCRIQDVHWKGVGKHVLKGVDNFALKNKIHSLSLTAENISLIKYYEKFSWTLRNDLHNNYMIKIYN
jgi:hypothetical protein